MHLGRTTAVAVVAAASLAPLANASFTVVSLHPAGAASSVANGIRNGQKVGTVDGNTAIWNNANTLDTTLGAGTLYATDGVEQVGVQAGAPAAWYGTAGSKIDLTPNPPLPNQFGNAVPLAVFAGLEAGYGVVYNGNLFSHALLWADSGSGYTDLNPTAVDPNAASTAYGEYNLQEVGDYETNATGYNRHAAIWFGSAASLVDINPSGATASTAFAVYAGRQAGVAIIGGALHAGFWTGSAGSWTDLNPAGVSGSSALAVNDGTAANAEAGYVLTGGVEHAAYWAGTAASFDDLQAYLPAGYTSSRATGIWVNNANQAFITGFANNAAGNPEAMLWVQNVPEPKGALALLVLAPLALGRRHPRMAWAHRAGHR